MREVRNVLEELRMTYPVKGVDPKTQTNEESGNVQCVQGGESRHIFVGGSEPRLVSTHEAVGAAVDRHDGVDLLSSQQLLVGLLKPNDPVRSKQ